MKDEKWINEKVEELIVCMKEEYEAVESDPENADYHEVTATVLGAKIHLLKEILADG